MAIFIWAPLPWGSNDPAFWHLLAGLIFLLTALVCFSVAGGSQALSPAVKKSWLPILALVSFQCWVGAQYLFGLTISPYDTYVDLQLGIAYTLFFILCLQLVNSREKLQTFATVFVLAGTFQAFYGSFMTLSGLEYGFVDKKYNFIGMATGTFVGRNHYAGFLEMSLAVGVGLMLSQ